ncbi:MAG: hypothetical protein S4CHLAM102_00600 [Chlamydiia bacterium]|nr:hypothetical protein [Chlamydiia bacterium]
MAAAFHPDQQYPFTQVARHPVSDDELSERSFHNASSLDEGSGVGEEDPTQLSTLFDLFKQALEETNTFTHNAPCRFIPLPSLSYFCVQMGDLFEADYTCNTYGIPREVVSFTILVAKTASTGLETIQACVTLPLALGWVVVGTTLSFFANVIEGKECSWENITEFFLSAPKCYFDNFYIATLAQDDVPDESIPLFSVLSDLGTELCNEWEELPHKYSPIPLALNYLSKVQDYRNGHWVDHHCIPECAVTFTINALRLTLVALATIQFIATLPVAIVWSIAQVNIQASNNDGEFDEEMLEIPGEFPESEYSAVDFFNRFFALTLNYEPAPLQSGPIA